MLMDGSHSASNNRMGRLLYIGGHTSVVRVDGRSRCGSWRSVVGCSRWWASPSSRTGRTLPPETLRFGRYRLGSDVVVTVADVRRVHRMERRDRRAESSDARRRRNTRDVSATRPVAPDGPRARVGVCGLDLRCDERTTLVANDLRRNVFGTPDRQTRCTSALIVAGAVFVSATIPAHITAKATTPIVRCSASWCRRSR